MRLPVLAVCCVLAGACGPGGADVPALPEEPTPVGATVFTARDDLVEVGQEGLDHEIDGARDENRAVAGIPVFLYPA